MRRSLLIVLFLLASGGLAWAGWRASQSGQAEALAPETVAVRKGAIRQTVRATGVIEAASLVSVGAQVGGQIQSLPVQLGQQLAAGDLVAQIDPEEQQTDLLRAEASLAQIEAQILALKANISEADKALTRQRQLSERGLATLKDLEPAEAQLDVTRANLKSAEAQRNQAELSVQSARIALERTRITAPAAGTVVAVVSREGQTLNANQSSPTVIKLADLNTMVVTTEISEADVIHIRPGQKASFTLAGAPDMRFEAVLRGVEPAPASIATADKVDTGKAIYYNALLDVPNPEGLLRIGMSAEVSIELASADDALLIPASALIRDQEGRAAVEIWLPARATTERRAIETGIITTHDISVLSGLAEGDLIVTSGQMGSQTGSGAGRPRPAMGLF
ncbi:efflux RND transporter periplasmic adaptor subunit [Xinfangfangia sp. D13-10-4-6]|uniref:efflux RND transporter periplasmic adaptor subunit n=1 Tax=Pseudogemmobacter hezensis TaxID=2737662 RepID=UPI001553E883|nr:efflux RND transporter periplasmic adaptor subunit [Pseudogemmobacter hezensis]NPD14783.1 efflux RND transporter periplasmic adaptor subunit [Pseudogemmobacter hezensis]